MYFGGSSEFPPLSVDFCPDVSGCIESSDSPRSLASGSVHRGGFRGCATRFSSSVFFAPCVTTLRSGWLSANDSASNLQDDHEPRSSLFAVRDYFPLLPDSVSDCGGGIVLQGQQNEHLRKKALGGGGGYFWR